MREGAGAGSGVLRCGRRGQVRDRSKHPRERGDAKDDGGTAATPTPAAAAGTLPDSVGAAGTTTTTAAPAPAPAGTNADAAAVQQVQQQQVQQPLSQLLTHDALFTPLGNLHHHLILRCRLLQSMVRPPVIRRQ